MQGAFHLSQVTVNVVVLHSSGEVWGEHSPVGQWRPDPHFVWAFDSIIFIFFRDSRL